MRRIRRRKVLYGSMLSLIILMSFSLSCLNSFSAMLEDDATFVLTTKPIKQKGWYRPIASLATSTYSDSYFSSNSNIGNPTSSYLWRLFNYFDFSSNETLSPSQQQWLIGWEHASTLDFNLDYVYSFDFEIRFTGVSTVVGDPDMSKFLLCFPTNVGDSSGYLFENHSFTQSYLTDSLLATFAPSSWTHVGTAYRVRYNIGIYPETLFAGAYIDTDQTTGIDYIPIPGLYIWNNNALIYSPALSQDGTYKRCECSILPYSSSSFRVYTPDEWATHVQEQGFNDLSLKIDQATGTITQAIDNQTSTIVGSIEDATDNIINAGDPVDLSDLEAAHHAEHVLQNTLYSTSPYQASTTSAIFASLFSGGFEDAVDSLNAWMDYAFNNNILIMYAVYYSIAAAIIYMAYRVVF